MEDTILLLGGAGRAGSVAARLLLEHTDARIVIGGRSRERAAALAARLDREFPGGRAEATAVDATDESSLCAALEGKRLLFDCGPTALFTERLARTALSAGVDCIDIHPSRSLAVLRPLAAEIERAGRCFVTQAGLHPGLPSTLMRYAAAQVQGCDTVAGGMLFNIGAVDEPDSAVELIEEMAAYKSLLYRDGAWRRPSWTESRRFDFGPGLGTRACYPMWGDELEGLPERLHLKEAGFYVAGFNWFVDWTVIPAALALGSLRRGLGARPLARLMAFGIRRFGRSPFAIVIALEAARGSGSARRGARVVVRSEDDDGYRLTAVAAVACLKQLLDGAITRPGLHLMGHLADPARLVEDMRRMGIGVSTERPD